MTTELDINLLRRTLGAGASADDFEMFVQQCRRTGLDPFARQICMVLRRNKSASGDWQACSPCSEMSKPSRSASGFTRKPIVISISFNAT